MKISGLSDHSTWKYSVYWFSGNRVFPRFWGQFSPEFSPDGGASEWVSEAGLDAGLDGKGPVQLRGGGAFRRRIQVGIDVRSGREIAVAEPLLDIFHGNTVFQKQRGAGMPLWHNKIRKEDEDMRLKYHMVTIEDLVPAGHYLRKLEAALDFRLCMKKQPACTAGDTAGRP